MNRIAEYEARKAERARLEDMDEYAQARAANFMMLDMLDRLVTAAERIADAAEKMTTPRKPDV